MKPANTSWKRVDIQSLLRACGISLVVLNHAEFASDYFRGGMTILMLLSGISFATLVFGKEKRDFYPSMLNFVKLIFFVAVAMEILSIVIKQRFDLVEFLMIGNWFHLTTVSIFPIWYVQVLVQMIIAFALIFYLIDMPSLVKRHPELTSGIFLLAAMAIAAVSKTLWDTNEIHDRLPHLYAWVFILGWVYWAFFVQRRPDTAARLLLSATAVLAALVTYYTTVALGWQTESRAVYMAVALLLLAWLSEFRAPGLLVHVVNLTSRSALFIYLFHISFMRIVDAVVGRLSPAAVEHLSGGLLRLAAGLLGPIVLWVAFTAAGRALRAHPLKLPFDPLSGAQRGLARNQAK